MISNVVCTICSKNYLAFARTLMHSVKETMPHSDRCVLIVDEDHGEIRPEDEDFTMIWAQDLPIPNFEIMAFQYNITELNTAVKPVYLQYLFQQGYKKVIYLDPDIYVYRSLDRLFGMLDDFQILLTPHILTSIPDDDYLPHEPYILISGLYNLGFLGIRRGQDAEQFLRWWGKKLQDRCIIANDRGIFVDQKWIDLVPLFYDHVGIIKEPGFNAAYWNLHERLPITFDAARKPMINQQHDLYFYHFSGINIDDLVPISKHQNRFTLNTDSTGLKILFEDYREQILKHGHEITQQWKYAFNHFDNGISIKKKVRRRFLEAENKLQFGNPFHTAALESFYQSIYPPSTNRTLAKRLFGKPVRFMSGLLQQGRTSLRTFIFETIFPRLSSSRIVGKYGINISGYLHAEAGIGEAARSLIPSLSKRKIPYALNNFSFGTPRTDERALQEPCTEANPFFCNVMHINADQLPKFYQQKPRTYFRHRYNIGVWYWELARFPQKRVGSFRFVDELWVATDFIRNALSPDSPVPIVKIPPAIVPPYPLKASRSAIGIPESACTFLFFFDFWSIMERKNPLGVITAFRKAFPSSTEDVTLVMKCSNYDHPSVQVKVELLNSRIKEDGRILLLSQHFTRMQMWELLAASDVFVSLHRSEGLGLGLLEAMSLGKPVIGTAYGGNTEFMTPQNSCLVNYKFVELQENYGPYQKGNVWAEPDLDEAATIMRTLYEDRHSANLLGQAAQREIREKYSPEEIGKKIEHRLNVITRNRGVNILS